MMKTLEVRVQITPDGQLIMPMVTDIQPGEYNAVLVLDTGTKALKRPSETLQIFTVDQWPEGMSLRREDEYGDDGR